MYNNIKLHPDQKYINALLQNDTALINEMYKRFTPGIKRMIIKNKGTETDAADIFQDGMLAIYCMAKKGSFVLETGFEAYLYRVCRNKWIDKLNKPQNFFKELKDDIRENSDENSFEVAEEFSLQHQRLELFAEYFAKLEARSKELLSLNWSGISMKKVASMLNLRYSYVRKNKCDTIKKLKMLIKQSPTFTFMTR